jgi:GPH family glycoside/pentoside/hexuronide:cation symporter
LTLAAYSLPALPLAMLSLPLYVLLPSFYARELALPIAGVGTALLAVRMFDAVCDPVAGVLADRWRPTFGRRRLWTLCAALPTALAAYQIFTPHAVAGLWYLVFWGAVLSAAWTALLVPYTAWGAELSTTYEGRTRIAGWREMLAVAGTLAALVIQALVSSQAGERTALFVIGLTIAIGLPITSLLAVAATPEPPDTTTQRIAWRDGLRSMMRNRPFVRLLIAFLLNGFANGFPATLFLFFVSENLQAKDSAGPLLVLYFLCGVAGVPLWLALARRTSKHRAWSLAMIGACVMFGFAPFLKPGDVWLFAIICAGTGLALGADLMLPPAIQADVIDVDTAATGEQRSGLYFALWSLATKLALAAAVGVAFPLLAQAGFDPASGLRTDSGLAMLGFLYAGAPVLLKLLAVWLMWSFPLDAAEQARLRRLIDTRSAIP